MEYGLDLSWKTGGERINVDMEHTSQKAQMFPVMKESKHHY